MSVLTKIFGDPNAKVVALLDAVVQQINALESACEGLTNEQLWDKTAEFRRRMQADAGGTHLDTLLPEAFAAVREAAKRTLGQRHFDVQLKGGIVLHRGQIAEMRTGEGKTLTSTLSVYLNALTGSGVHVVTVNDYLAKRDSVWMGQVYAALGMTVGVIQNQNKSFVYDPSYGGQFAEGDEGTARDTKRDTVGAFRIEDSYLRPATRAEAYQCDVTYGTNNEFGFDYLRDNMVARMKDMVQRGHAYAVVDEIDSILVDEARTPLIISAPAEEAAEEYYRLDRLVKQMRAGEHYEVDEKLRTAVLTDAGIKKMEDLLGLGNIYTEGGIGMVHHVEQALRANALFTRDRHYVVDGEEVVIIDEFTGRKMPGRRYSEGLHQAIEAKEGVKIQRESRTMATITFQNYFRLYDKLSGMTGTAVTEAEEFSKIYNLEVVVIPTNKPDRREDLQDKIYRTEAAKFQAVAAQVRGLHERGIPVLVGTISIEKNEELSLMLEREGIPHEILNAKNHEREGEIIAQAGRPGAVTLATNMAGRGVDIVLGGNPPEADDAARVRASGGLFVLGTERHESRRIDNQLRGRSGRQGDPGVTAFYVSVEDDLMRIFAGDRIKSMMARLQVPDDMPIEARMVSRAIETAQKKVEGHHFDTRKHLLEYDDVLNKHREGIYRRRREILELAEGLREKTVDGYETLSAMIEDMVASQLESLLQSHVPEDAPWETDNLLAGVAVMFPLSDEALARVREFAAMAPENDQAAEQALLVLKEAARSAYEQIEARAEPEMLREMERMVLLNTIDTLWVDHLVAIDRLRSGIGLRGYAQQDPLVEYKKETYILYQNLLGAIEYDVTRTIYKVGEAAALAPSIMESAGMVLRGAAKGGGGGAAAFEADADGMARRRVGRNENCPCGSGKKYKRCHGA